MKNKKLLYILVPLSLIIWGLIFYRIFTGLKNTDIPDTTRPAFKARQETPLKDSFTLVANYRDPFLGGNVIVAKPQTTSSSVGKRQFISTTTTPPPLPDVQYFGIISNAGNRNKVGLIKIQGRDFLLKEGETAEPHIKIIKFYKDSVILTSQSYKHTVKKA